MIRDGGQIVNINSGVTRFVNPDSVAYATFKGAVEVFTRYLAHDLGPRNINVNTVAPGAVQTDFSGGVVRDNPAVNKIVASMTALGRPGLPEDIGQMLASLLSDANHWINGQRIEVSGGRVRLRKSSHSIFRSPACSTTRASRRVRRRTRWAGT